VRKQGGGRYNIRHRYPNIDEVFLSVMKGHIAGNPMNKDANFLWTYLSISEIIDKLFDKGIAVSKEIIQQLLRRHKIGRRKIQKKGTIKTVANRNEQFEYIKKLITDYQLVGSAVLSMDVKKKEELGQLYRSGLCYTQQPLESYDHDYPSLREGVVIPHGLYDMTYNDAFICLGNSKDTAEFVLDCLVKWWEQVGNIRYRDKEKILILCDGGGSNNCRHYVFKQTIQIFANTVKKRVRIAHYPAYCSKYNPIEHRVFPHVTKAISGVMLDNLLTIKQLIEQRAKTRTGLRVVVHIIDKEYETGKKAKQEFIDNMPIVFDKILPKWNYMAIPRT